MVCLFARLLLPRFPLSISTSLLTVVDWRFELFLICEAPGAVGLKKIMNFSITTDPVVPTHHAVLSSFMRETGSPTQPLSQKPTKTWKQLGDRFGSRSEYWSNNALVNTPFNKTTFGLLSSRTAELCESFKYFLKNRYCATQINCQPIYICLKADTPLVMNCSYSAIERLEWKRSRWTQKERN